MKKIDANECQLRLKNLLFDKILFERQGMKNDNKLKLTMRVKISENLEESLYRVALTIQGEKKEEYELQVTLFGFFQVIGEDLQKKEILLHQNAVAILMPYVRSQLSLLTAQPDTECIVLPPFNIAKMIEIDTDQAAGYEDY